METNDIKYLSEVLSFCDMGTSASSIFCTHYNCDFNLYKMSSTDFIYLGIKDTLIVYVFVMCICTFIVAMCI